MKKITLTLFALVLYVSAYCGVPQAISYQAVALNGSGSPVKNKNIAMRLSIIPTTPSNASVYQERQTVTTDASGVVSMQIGNGSVISGSFSTIDWSKGVYYLKTEIDTNAGTNYINTGTSQFFSVPFSLYSGTAGQANLSSPENPDGLTSVSPVMLNGVFTYTVPTGQTLYITQISSNGNTSSTCSEYGASVEGIFFSSKPVPGTTISPSAAAATNKYIMDNPVVVPQGISVSSTSCATSVVGYTVPKGYSWVLFDLSIGSYTVPAGQILVIQNMITGQGTTWGSAFTIGSNTTSFSKHMVIADQGQTITASGLSGGSLLMMGYLKNK